MAISPGIVTAAGGVAQAQSLESLRELSLEDLTEIEITSVSKRPEPVSRAPAAVFVITSDDIRRSGATSLPEVLRLAPNLQVARVNTQSYAISSRGFNTFQAAVKSLVLIDGRSIYTPLHGGVLWDQHQVMLEDVERIEVISGPGGTLWGANAFNGVINIITKHTRDTEGGLARLQVGNTELNGALRYGGPLGDSGSYRVYGMGFERDSSETENGASLNDGFGNGQGGFRADWTLGQNALTLQGDVYRNPLDAGGSISGHNILGRWTRQLGSGAAIELQTYYDSSDRSAPGVSDKLETFDIQAQHLFRPANGHEIVWGGGYRLTDDEFVNTLNQFVLTPPSDTVHLGNIFAQDSISLTDNLTLTLGTKFEYSSYSGLEYLPSVRLAWQVSDRTLLWSAVSRAVRTPTRIDRDLNAAGLVERAGDDFNSEKLLAYEVGYRGQLSQASTLSVSAYYNDYDDLRVLTVSPDSGLFRFGNAMKGYSYGVEIWGDHRVTEWWRISAGLNLMQKNLELEPGATTLALEQHAGNDPDYQFSLRSQFNLSRNIDLDIALRGVDDLPSPSVPGYVEADLRLAWRPRDSVEFSIAGFNLLDEGHPETGALPNRATFGRTIYVGTRWNF